MRTFLSLGSNLGDRVRYLRHGVETLPDVVAVSPVYETDPMGGPAQDDYLNIVVELDTELSPNELLEIKVRAAALFAGVTGRQLLDKASGSGSSEPASGGGSTKRRLH